MNIEERLAEIEARANAATEEACHGLDEWLAEKHPESECDGECVTTRRIFVEQAKAVIRGRLAAARTDVPDLVAEIKLCQRILGETETTLEHTDEALQASRAEARRLRDALETCLRAALPENAQDYDESLGIIVSTCRAALAQEGTNTSAIKATG